MTSLSYDKASRMLYTMLIIVGFITAALAAMIVSILVSYIACGGDLQSIKLAFSGAWW